MTMPTLPPAIRHRLAPFAPCFSRRVWPLVVVLLAGAILAPGKRTVTAALRVMGLAHDRGFGRYHRVLNRDRWSGLAVGRVLLELLVAVFVPDGPPVVGVDETRERRRGKKIAPKGISRDAVRSSHEHFVTASGVRARLPDAAGSGPVDAPSVGPAFPDRAGALRALRPRARAAP
jgi:hypothetical protein